VLALVFFTLEQGPAFAAETAFWTIPGMAATIPIYFAYLAAADRVRGPLVAAIAAGALAALVTFAVSITVIGLLPLTRTTAVPFAALVCFAAAWLVRRLPDTAPLQRVRPSAGLLLARAGVSAGMVIAITGTAHLLGPKWSGLVAGFPVKNGHHGQAVRRPAPSGSVCSTSPRGSRWHGWGSSAACWSATRRMPHT
jgi:hypothetical protein